MDNASVKKIDGRSKNGGHSTAEFAGAKKKPISEKRVPISSLVAPETLDKIKKIKSVMGVSIGVTIDAAIDLFFEEINNSTAQSIASTPIAFKIESPRAAQTSCTASD